MNIFLIGYRCTGKTVVGQQLARRLDLSFVDADRELVGRTGTSIDEMVSKKGWGFFRSQEQSVLERLCRAGGIVVATGGGVVLEAENVRVMKNSGVLIWLKAASDTIKKRMTTDSSTGAFRPKLTDKGVVEEIETVLSQRIPLYQSAADLAVDTDNLAVAAIADDIVEKMENSGYVEQIRNTV